jgi:dihydrolipoamide dehydrogenase
VDIYNGYSRMSGDNIARVADTDIKYTSIIIASGSKPKIPPMFDLPGIWTSENIFELTEIPHTLLIIGGGVIGMEMAHVFSNLGTEVTVIEAMDRILPTEDEDVSKEISSLYRKIRFITCAAIIKAEAHPEFTLTIETQGRSEIVSGRHLLLCIGREPNIPQGATELGLSLSTSGGILVDKFMQTNLPGVFAIGDVTGRYMYAYVASKGAEIAIDHIVGGSKSMDYSVIPSVIFTSPEIASVGKSLKDLDPASIRKGSFPVSALGRARTLEASEGFAHVYSTQDGKIERISILAPHATELISWATLAISHGLHVEDFLKPYYPHPTMSELLKEAVEDVIGLSIHKP